MESLSCVELVGDAGIYTIVLLILYYDTDFAAFFPQLCEDLFGKINDSANANLSYSVEVSIKENTSGGNYKSIYAPFRPIAVISCSAD